MLGAGSRRRWAARAPLLLLLGASFLVLDVEPAGAHGLTGVQPSNFATRVLSVTPSTPGLKVAVLDLGGRLEVQNDTHDDVVILGYSGEPYLRVGPAGVYENRRSPAVFLDRSSTVVASVPRSFDASAAPEWRRIGGGHVVRWHDHRIHWMGGSSVPQVVRGSPGRVHLVERWTVTLRTRGHDVTVRGDLRWIPGPSALPRLALALLVAALIGAVGFTRRWGDVIAVTLSGLAAAAAVLVVGEWSAVSSGIGTALLATAYSVLGVVVALAAAGAMFRSRDEPGDAAAIALVAAIVLTFGSGLADVTYLSRSQLPTTLPGPPARTLVAVVLGGSVGVLVTAARKLRRPLP
jgi:hypothetical protein